MPQVRDLRHHLPEPKGTPYPANDCNLELLTEH